MKVVYAGRDVKKRKVLLAQHQNVIVLLHDNWDDYTFKTTFPTDCRMKGANVEIGGVQILIENEKTSFAYLDKLVADGWDGAFPISNGQYISVPASLSFYEQIDGHLGLDSAIDVARILRDASLLTKIEDDEDALRLLATDGFRNSLQRERGPSRHTWTVGSCSGTRPSRSATRPSVSAVQAARCPRSSCASRRQAHCPMTSTC